VLPRHPHGQGANSLSPWNPIDQPLRGLDTVNLSAVELRPVETSLSPGTPIGNREGDRKPERTTVELPTEPSLPPERDWQAGVPLASNSQNT